ncbi:MAG: C25 family cysteine peptidase [Candidatus Zixiibacteriota bacterium]
MKKVILLSFLVALFVCSFAWAYRVNLAAVDEIKVELISADASKVRVELFVPEIQVEDKLVEGETYQMLTIPGGGWVTEVGSPQIPLFCRFVALPPSSGVRIEVVEQEMETLPGTFLVHPFQKPPIRGENPEPEVFQLNDEVYSQNQVFPGNLVEAGEISILRDLRLAPIKFFPVQYNPRSGEVTVCKRLVVDIYFEGAGENPQLNPRNVLTRSFVNTYERFVLNFDEVQGGKDLVDGSVLIITYDAFNAQVQPLAESKRRRGLSTHLVNLSTVGSTNTQIYNYIYDAYHTWADPPEYVILVGDIGQIPTNNGLTCITDHKYVTVDGSDYFADIHIGRISVQTQSEAAHVVAKTLNYRNSPYTDETEWFMRGMTISGSDYVDDYNALICGRYMVDYAGFTYFDSLWNSLGNDSPSQISSRLNQGRSWIAYFGHGYATGWSPSGFDNGDINALNNGEKLPAIFSVACNNAEFDYYSDCFAERWIKVGEVGNEKGAVIICASTRGSSFFYSDTLGRGTYEAYFKDSLFHFTPAVNQGKMKMYTYFPEGSGGTTEREMQMYTTLGDPELDPWSAIPQNLEVTHPEVVFMMEGGEFPVTVELNGQPMKDALVCLIKGTEVYESARTGPDGQVTLYPVPETPGLMDVIVSGHNAYNYETTVEVIPLSGPYMVYVGCQIDDDNTGESQGDGDGDVDIGETIELPVMLKNLGDSTGIQVTATLSTTRPLVTITDDYEEFGDIPAGDSAYCLDDFDFWISPETPDGEIITFNLDIAAENGEGPWNYPSLEIEIHAPVLAYKSCMTDDIGGDDDGKPDPGETCIMDIVLENNGSGGAAGVQAELISGDPYVTVMSASSGYPDIAPWGSSTSSSSYQFFVSGDCPLGHVANMTLQISTAAGYSASDGFQLIIGQKLILYVDDDDGETYESYFFDALDSVGFGYDVWEYESQGCPPDTVLEFYQVVIWSTGDDYGTLSNPKTLTALDQARLMTFLDNGGNLFLSSQDFLLDNNPNTFITDYLHLAGHSDDKTVGSVAGIMDDTISHGMSFALSYPFFNFSDWIFPGVDASGVFYETSKGSSPPRADVQIDHYSGGAAVSSPVDYCALRYPSSGPSVYKVVFMAFPFEAVPQFGSEPNNSTTLMSSILSWFGLGRAPEEYMAGDANGDEAIDVADVVFLVNFLYKGEASPNPYLAGDANCDGEVNLADVVYLVNYLYRGGDPPPC